MTAKNYPAITLPEFVQSALTSNGFSADFVLSGLDDEVTVHLSQHARCAQDSDQRTLMLAKIAGRLTGLGLFVVAQDDNTLRVHRSARLGPLQEVHEPGEGI